jgi:alpha-galactosidase
VKTLSEFNVGDVMVRYLHDDKTGRVGLQMVPVTMLARMVPRRPTLRGLPFIDTMPGNDPWPAAVLDSLVQLKLVGDQYPGAFAQGHTMREAGSVDGFRFVKQTVEASAESTTVLTVSVNPAGCRTEHRLTWESGASVLQITTTFVNGSPAPVILEMLSSFSLGGLTPFATDDASGRLRVHRFRSAWSAEGRLETRTLEELHLERSWSGAAAFSERFGQVGTMPVRRWFPFVAIEDTEAGVVWGAQISWAGSWQLEVFRQHDEVCISGGLADREFGHWMKTLQIGESLVTPEATLSCVAGSLDRLCDRLTGSQQRAVDAQPAVEQDLPIVFNEWCTTWGDPQHDRILAIADRLAGSEVRYLVIDAGWYKSDKSDWSGGHGDWIPSKKLFPHGIEATAAAIRERGLIPGLWFEMETVGSQSTAFSLGELLLQRDGRPVTVRDRRFWNLNNPEAIAYLSDRVIDLLERGGFGYLKVDYNETLGLGAEHSDGLGEGLRQQVLGSYRFFEKIRERMPHLVIENCASGGHRLEPSMLSRTAMSSFSDAHELVEIPLIAANLHRLILPRQSQIWAVLHAADSDERLVFSLASTFLGRMCLSGEIEQLSRRQWDIALEAQKFYRRVAPIIKHGVSRIFGEISPSWRHQKGWQAVVRTANDGRSALVVAHTFAGAASHAAIRLDGAGWNIVDGMGATNHPRLGVDQTLQLAFTGDFTAQVWLLQKS